MKYHLKGIYSFRGMENPLSGTLFIDGKGKIEGEMEDKNSICSKHKIEGKIYQKNNIIILEFLKKPVGTLMCDIFYKLKKVDVKKDFEGNYEGFWNLNDEGIELGIGYQKGVGESVFVRPTGEIRNRTSLSITSKL